jgi:hypothetical protein
MHCVNTPSLTLTHLTSFADEMTNSHMYKLPQNNLYSYYMIAHSLRKIHISENKEKLLIKD